MLVFRMLCRITQSSKAHRTESVSVMDHEQYGSELLQSVGPETAKHLWPYLIAAEKITKAVHTQSTSHS